MKEEKCRCNNCLLVLRGDIEECPICKTDKYLMQPFEDLKKFDRYEQFVIKDLMKRGNNIEDAIKIVINQTEGDYSQLSETIKKYIKQ